MNEPSPHILITRPRGQHLEFTRSLQALGFTVSHLPCLEIEPLHEKLLAADLADRFDTVLFTSVNAVSQAHRQRPLPWSSMRVHAIGAATADALGRLGQPLAMIPEAPFSSEACVAQLRQLQPARLLIIKGQGGRALVASELEPLGWQVSTASVYRRIRPGLDPHSVARLLTDPPPLIVSVTSNEVLHNLVVLAREHLGLLRQLPLVLNSHRAAELARSLGFSQQLLVASPAGDAGQLAQLQEWLDSRRGVHK